LSIGALGWGVQNNSKISLRRICLGWLVAPLEENSSDCSIVNVTNQIFPDAIEPERILNVLTIIYLKPSKFTDKKGFAVLARKIEPSRKAWSLSTSPKVREGVSTISSVGSEDVNI